MPQDNRWWRDDANERFWLESTRRDDIGADLRAPLGDGDSDKAWRYELFKEANVGDVVFHYDGKIGAVTAVSRIAGPWAHRPIVWAARGSYARRRNATPTESDGYFVPLDDHRRLDPPLTLDLLRARSAQLRSVTGDLRGRHATPLYFPFELSDRPVRPLQGYAFKLPAAIVADFPELRGALTDEEASWLGAPAPSVANGSADIASLAERLNAVAAGRPIGELQALRRALRGQTRTKTQKIFSPDSIKSEYAFHSGGRDELQFNIGLDEFADSRPALRAGVAFSLETSRSLPTIDPLVPKIRRFNDFLRAHPEAFGDMAMWHFADDRSIDRPPAPIPVDLAVEGVFLFLGVRQPVDRPDVDACLDAFDRLLPLWRYVESGQAQDSAPSPSDVSLQLERGRLSKPARWATATFPERQLNIELRHNAIQERLRDLLHARHGEGCVRLEPPVVGRYVDAVLTLPSGQTFYEVKTADTVRQCLREALGQLLDYALWPGASAPDRLIVVGEPVMDAQAAAYLARLNAQFPIPIDYESVPLD